jgi:hypothetical protein
MQAWILALAILAAAGGALSNWWQSVDDMVIMTDGANPIPPKP